MPLTVSNLLRYSRNYMEMYLEVNGRLPAARLRSEARSKTLKLKASSTGACETI